MASPMHRRGWVRGGRRSSSRRHAGPVSPNAAPSSSSRTIARPAGAAALATSRLGYRQASAAPVAQGGSQLVGETPHLVIIFLEGGLNALFCSGDSFLGATADRSFGVTSDNTQQLGSSGVFVDKA